MASDCLCLARQARARWAIGHSNVSAFERSPIRRREVLLARILLPPRKTRIGRDARCVQRRRRTAELTQRWGNPEVPKLLVKTGIRRIPSQGSATGFDEVDEAVVQCSRGSRDDRSEWVASQVPGYLERGSKTFGRRFGPSFRHSKGEPGASMLSP